MTGSTSFHIEVSVQDGTTTPETKQLADAIEAHTWQNWFECWLQQLQPDASPIRAYELSLRLTEDTEIQSLNAQYRSRDQPTDVLSFATLEAATPLPLEVLMATPLYLGDIVISVETAQRQAEQQGHGFAWEVAWLAVHGLLHLLGWDHPDDLSLKRMLDQQDALLRAISWPHPCD